MWHADLISEDRIATRGVGSGANSGAPKQAGGACLAHAWARRCACCMVVGFAVTAACSGTAGADVPTDDELRAQGDLMAMFAAQTRSNYERIRTWSGRYDLVDRVLCRELTFKRKADLGKDVDVTDAGPGESVIKGSFIVRRRLRVEFDIDVPGNKLRTSCSQDGMTVIEAADDGDDTEIAVEALPIDSVSIVTPEHYLHTRADAIQPADSDKPDDIRVIRGVVRDPPEVSEAFNKYSSVVDPRIWFGCGGRSFYNNFEVLAGALAKGQDVMLRIKKDTNPANESIYLVDKESFVGSVNGPRMLESYRIDAKVGFHPIEVSEVYPDGTTRTRIRWEYKKVNGVFVPETYVVRKFGTQGDIQFERRAVLANCAINDDIPSDVFTYKGLGVEDGARVADRILGKDGTLLDGKPVLVDKFGTVPSKAASFASARTILVSVNIGILCLVVLWFVNRKARKRRCSESVSP